MLRQDRVLLENLEDKYGTDAVARTIMMIANNQNPEIVNDYTPKDAVFDFIKYIEGVRIRLREIHWSTERHSKHILTDDIIATLEDVEDNIAEDFMGICGCRIQVGAVVPTIPSETDLSELLANLNHNVITLCGSIENDSMYGGIVNELEDLMHKISKWKYLATFK